MATSSTEEALEEVSVPVFPNEIFECILRFCDGNTLITAQTVSKDWHDIVAHLGKHTPIWKERCLLDIPTDDFTAILNKFCIPRHHPSLWEIFFKNWFEWKKKTIKRTMLLEIFKGTEDFKLNCAKQSGFNMAIGCEEGFLLLLDELGECRNSIYPNPSPILDLVFMNVRDNYDDNGYFHTHLILAYHNALLIMKIEPTPHHVQTIYNVCNFSTYQNFICFQTYIGILEVWKLVPTASPTKCLKKVTTTRIHAPKLIKSLCIWQDTVSIVTSSHIFSFQYTTGERSAKLQVGQLVTFPVSKLQNIWMFQNKIIFALVANMLQVTTINSSRVHAIDKVFNTMEMLGSLVLSIYLHGSILFIGTASGSIFMYCVEDWNSFHLSRYYQRLDIQSQPVLMLDIQELDNEQALLLAYQTGVSLVYLTD